LIKEQIREAFKVKGADGTKPMRGAADRVGFHILTGL
jgi:hypothetical protein